MNMKELLELLGPDDPLVRVMLRETGTASLNELATQMDRYHDLADQQEFLVIKDEHSIARKNLSGVNNLASDSPTQCDQALDELTEKAFDNELQFLSNENITPSIKAGQRIGPYQLVARIGSGGFGQVYSAYHVEQPEQYFAIKVFANSQLGAIDRLEIEKFVLQKLQHPNLVAAVDSGRTESGITFLVMNLVEGVSIERYAEQAKLSFTQIAELFAVIASAIQYAHDQDVLHRDLKPSNILVTKEGVPVVVDFGLAKRLDPGSGHSITISGGLVGTLGYLAPEQATSSRAELTRAVDVYGLGATLYHVLTGRAPFERDNVLKALEQIREDRPTPPKAINPAVPIDLQKICLTCLQKTPSDRYAAMEQLGEDLRRFAVGERIVGCGLDWRVALWRWAKENPALAWLSAGLVASVLVGSMISVWSWRQAIIREQRTASVLETAREILVQGDRSAEANLQMTSGSLKYRKERLQESVSFFDELVEQFPDHTELYRESATSWFRLAKVNVQLGHWQEARSEFLTAMARFEALAVHVPDDHELQFDLFHCLLGLDWTDSNLDETYQSWPVERQHCFEAFGIISQLVALQPENIDYQDALACAAGTVGGRYALIGDTTKAFEHFDLAWQTASKLKEQLPKPCQQWAHVGGSASKLASMNHQMGNLNEALKWSNIARKEIQAYLDRDSLNPGELGMWASWMTERIRLDRTMGNQEQADKLFEELGLFIEECRRKYPDYFLFQEFESNLAEYECAELKQK
jgi:serine/threonine protein kinase